MVVPMILLKVVIHWLFSCYRYTARKFRIYGFLHKTQSRSSHFILSSCPNVRKCALEKREHQTFVSDFYTLLRPNKSHFFPFFMLVAFEGGGLVRALFLLLSSPICWAFGWQSEISLRIMIFVAFCGLKIRDMELVGRAVLPKFYLESLHLQAYQVLASSMERKVVLSSLPRVMFEAFAREYLGVSEVVGAELKVFKGKYYSGLISCCGFESKHKALKQLFGEAKADVGLVSHLNPHDHLFISHCKEAYIVSKDSSAAAALPRDKYPKPLIFHDSRLAFLPTPLSILALFLFLPLSIPLSIARIALGVIPPYKLVFIFAALNGVRFRAQNHHQYVKNSTTDKIKHAKKGTLFVCTHRTLLDPVMLATALQRPVPAVTYSLSPLSEAIAPMRTIRLTRNRNSDSDTILKILKEGDLTICPEGTTCREPYLLRFSPLFAELADEIVPVALEASASWFYGTTASGLKLFDPFFFFMNPMPSYRVEFLERVPKEMTCAGGGWSGSDVANRIQKQLGDAMGYECTNLTRRDKYLMLAGNEGVVKKQEQEIKKESLVTSVKE